MPVDTTTSTPAWPVSMNAPAKALTNAIKQKIQNFIDVHQLGPAFSQRIPSLYAPMTQWIAQQQHDKPLLVGINGGQGSGKSTLTALLQLLLIQAHDKRVVSLSIDDLYLTLADRQQLAHDIHPLLLTRGVPGTHDMVLAEELFSNLLQPQANHTILVPRFDKSIDDRAPESDWQSVNMPADIILFEGWFVGARPQSAAELEEPVNELESSEDIDGIWRRYVNEQLAGSYQQLFNKMDILMMLKVPSMEQVYEWRGLQEDKLKKQSSHDAAGVMDNYQLKRFIMHFERLTRHQLQEMPERADVLMPLDRDHQIADVILNKT